MTDIKRYGVEAREEPPAAYKHSLEKAQARSLQRKHGPVMTVDPETTALTSPFSEAEEEWRWMVIDTFGTRSHQVANVFLQHLSVLCASAWNDAAKCWVPDEDELTAVLHIVAAHRPKNEAQAALAAQIAATHMITMKVAKHAYSHPYDSRTVSSYAKLAKTAASQVETMSGLKGKRRTTRQQINVVHEKHIHQHQHVHAGDVEKSEGQCDATHTDQRSVAGAGQVEGCAKVSGPDEKGRVVRLKSRAG